MLFKWNNDMVTEFFLSKTCCSVAKWCPTLCNLCPPLSPGICSNSCPLSRWCYQTISSSVSVRLIQVSVSSVEFSCSVVSDSLWPTPWIAARQASMSITNSRGSLRLTSIESVLHRLKQNVEFLGCVAEIKMNLYLNIIDRMGHSALQIIAVDLKQNF